MMSRNVISATIFFELLMGVPFLALVYLNLEIVRKISYLYKHNQTQSVILSFCIKICRQPPITIPYSSFG